MRVEKCYFCSSTIYPGRGTTFVRNDCKVFHFCSSKCHNNFKLKRNPRKTRWTKAYRRSHGKEMRVDSTFDFERRRDVPVPYSRDLVQRTVQAMRRVAEIRKAREVRFFAERMRGNKALHKKEALRVIKEGIDLVISPMARQQVLLDNARERDIEMAVDGEGGDASTPEISSRDTLDKIEAAAAVAAAKRLAAKSKLAAVAKRAK